MRSQLAKRHGLVVGSPGERGVRQPIQQLPRHRDLVIELREQGLLESWRPDGGLHGRAGAQGLLPAGARVGHFLKSTLGTALASGGAWKYGYSLKPNIFAVMFAGNCRRIVSYSRTRSL